MRTPIASAFGLLALVFAMAIRDIGRKWEKMFADKDSSGIGRLFADEGYEMPPGTKAMKGPDEVTKGVGESTIVVSDGQWKVLSDINSSEVPGAM